MTRPFDSFVILASMRTGSNFLEESLAGVPGLACFGEAFNPAFIGQPGKSVLVGVSIAERSRDPFALLQAMQRAAGASLAGFRLFPGHDLRIRDRVLADPRCAKIILSRNPAETYVSRKIAEQTGQWKLTGFRRRRSARVAFVPHEFESHLSEVQAERLEIERALQTGGQAAFHLNYDDLGDLDIFNGLLRFLGLAHRIEALPSRLRKQNPAAMPENVINFAEMEEVAARLDPFMLSRLPDLEPRRGPGVPGYVATPRTRVLYMPIMAALGDNRVEQWLAALDGVTPVDLERGFTRKALARWLGERPGLLAFTVVSHPLTRAHAAFEAQVLPGHEAPHPGLRRLIEDIYGVPLRPDDPRPDPERTRAAFLGFLRLVAASHAGQTGLRIDARWAGQTTLLSAMTTLRPPDRVLRAERLNEDLAELGARLAQPGAPLPAPGALAAGLPHGGARAPLDLLYDDEIEAAARAAFAADYLYLGYGPWRAAAP